MFKIIATIHTIDKFFGAFCLNILLSLLLMECVFVFYRFVLCLAEEKRKQEFFKARGLLKEQKEGLSLYCFALI